MSKSSRQICQQEKISILPSGKGGGEWVYLRLNIWDASGRRKRNLHFIIDFSLAYRQKIVGLSTAYWQAWSAWKAGSASPKAQRSPQHQGYEKVNIQSNPPHHYRIVVKRMSPAAVVIYSPHLLIGVSRRGHIFLSASFQQGLFGIGIRGVEFLRALARILSICRAWHPLKVSACSRPESLVLDCFCLYNPRHGRCVHFHWEFNIPPLEK